MMDCSLEVNEIELQSRYYVHFQSNTIGNGINILSTPNYGLIVQLFFFYKDGFGIK